VIKNVNWSLCKVPLLLSDSKEAWIFLLYIEKHTSVKFHKMGRVGAELFHADGRTDGQRETTKLIVAFRNFATPLNIEVFPLLIKAICPYTSINTMPWRCVGGGEARGQLHTPVGWTREEMPPYRLSRSLAGFPTRCGRWGNM
jgi:hypothetical protein